MVQWATAERYELLKNSRIKAVISHDTPSCSNNTMKVEMDGHVAQ